MTLEVGIVRKSIQFQFTEAELVANTALDLVADDDGFVDSLDVVIQKTITTGGTLNVQIGPGGTPGTNVSVAGMQMTIANSAAKGTVQASTVPTKLSDTRAFKKGQRIRILPASFATAGALNGQINYNTGGLV